MTVQTDFGSYDPTFLGVTLRFSSESAWRAFVEFTTSPSPPSIADLPPAERFEALASTTVLSHELRHFHDFLLSSYGARLFSLRIQALVNLVEVLPYLVADGPNCLPVPLPVWCRLDRAERQEQLSLLDPGPDACPWVPVSLPHISAVPLEAPKAGFRERDGETLGTLLAAAMYQRQRIEELTRGSRIPQAGSLDALQVFELSSLLVQIQDVWRTYGAPEAREFMHGILAEERSVYAHLLRMASRIWEQAGLPFDARQIGTAVAWSLFGSYERDGWEACPAMRFGRLSDLLKERGSRSRDIAGAELFDTWSSALGLSTVREGLEDATRVLQSLRRSLERQVLGKAGSLASKAYGELLVRAVDGVARSSEHMARRFLDDPDAYVYPDAYLSRASELVSPVLRVAFSGSGLRLEEAPDRLLARGIRVQWQEASSELSRSIFLPFDPSPYSFLQPDDVSELATLIEVTDFLFSETGRGRDDLWRAGRTFFEESKVRPFELMV